MIVFDNYLDQSMTGAVSSFTLSFTLGSPNPGILVLIEDENTGVPTNGVKWNGTALTQIDLSTTHNDTYVYSLTAPTGGAHNLVVDFGVATPFGHISVISFTGVSQITAIDAHGHNQVTNAASDTIALGTVTANTVLVDMLCENLGGAVAAANANQTVKLNALEDTRTVAVSYTTVQGGSGSHSIGWTGTTITTDHVAVALRPTVPSFKPQQLRPHIFSPGLAR